MDEFCRSLPKIELHAHLNGSLSLETVEKLLKHHQGKWPQEKMPEGADTLIQKGRKGTFDDPFEMFALIHRITDNPWAVGEATRDVIREFQEDGVIYLELRTTPREVEGRMTRDEYCRTVIKGIEEMRAVYPDMMIKLLLAIDRRRLGDTENTVQLFLHLRSEFPEILAGLDISGDPRVGDIVSLIPRLKELREKEGIKLAIHLAEVANKPETLQFLAMRPDRIGHGTCIHPSLGGDEDTWEKLKEGVLEVDKAGESTSSGDVILAVETCMSSNVICSSVPSYSQHQAGIFFREQVPFILCTDDKGVFSCSLSGEYLLASEAFNWSREQLFSVARNGINYCFASDGEKKTMKNVFAVWKEENSRYFNDS